MRIGGAALAAALLVARPAAADPDADAEAALRAAAARATSGDEAGALAALEALGAARPVTRWTDNAWAEAARLAERGGDLARARRDLAQAAALADDDTVRRRAEAALARLAAKGGAAGEWDAVAAQHDRLASAILGGAGAPEPLLDALAALIAAHAEYPGATAARLVMAQGWERAGDAARARAILDDAIAQAPTPELRGRARYAAFHAALHARDLDAARDQLGAIASAPDADRGVVAQLADDLASAELRARIRIGVTVGILAVLALGMWRARRDARSWAAVARALARPPLEVWFVAPLLGGLALVAAGGNPMVARALRAIAALAVGAAWLSGASLALAQARGALGRRRIAAHVALLGGALVGALVLIADRDRLLDLVLETWRAGPALR